MDKKYLALLAKEFPTIDSAVSEIVNLSAIRSLPKWTAFAIAYQCLFAYAVSLIIYQFGLLFTGSVNVIGLIFAVIVLAFMIYMLVRPYKESSRLTTTVKVNS